MQRQAQPNRKLLWMVFQGLRSCRWLKRDTMPCCKKDALETPRRCKLKQVQAPAGWLLTCTLCNGLLLPTDHGTLVGQ
jgi:hypothetical protein